MMSFSLCFNLTGCMTAEVLKPDSTYTQYQFQAIEQDSIIGFVMNKTDGKLIMLGKNHVYVFDDDRRTTRHLKAILTEPKFLTLKEMSWKTQAAYRMPDNTILYNPNDGTFSFDAYFSFKLHSKEEAKTVIELGLLTQWDHIFLNYETGRFEFTEEKYKQYGHNLDIGRTTWWHHDSFSGKVYDHNQDTLALIKNSKPLSKDFVFTLGADASEGRINKKVVAKKAVLLPFAVAGDIISAPFALLFLAGF